MNPPQGFTLQGIGGGFTAWVLRHGPLEMRVAHHLTGSAPVSLDVSAFVEISHEPMTADADPAEAVAEIRRLLDRFDGDNEESGALSYHFQTARDAVAWLTETLDALTFEILSGAALGVDGLTDGMRDSLNDHFNDSAGMFGAWWGVFDVLTNGHDIHTTDDDDALQDLMELWLCWGTPDTLPPLPVWKAMHRAVEAVANSTPTTGDGGSSILRRR
jgi:hypothetical protein